MSDWIQSATGRLADFTIGTAIVVVHLLMADRARRKALSARLSWPREEVDARLLQIMCGIHAACLRYGKRADGSVSYIDGANIAGFVKVADAMLAQGVL